MARWLRCPSTVCCRPGSTGRCVATRCSLLAEVGSVVAAFLVFGVEEGVQALAEVVLAFAVGEMEREVVVEGLGRASEIISSVAISGLSCLPLPEIT